MLYNFEHVGSKSIYKFIEQTQPFFAFHGHIHESYIVSKQYQTKIGRTICINPGQIHQPSIDAVIVEISSNEYKIEPTNPPSNATEIGKSMLLPIF